MESRTRMIFKDNHGVEYRHTVEGHDMTVVVSTMLDYMEMKADGLDGLHLIEVQSTVPHFFDKIEGETKTEILHRVYGEEDD